MRTGGQIASSVWYDERMRSSERVTSMKRVIVETVLTLLVVAWLITAIFLHLSNLVQWADLILAIGFAAYNVARMVQTRRGRRQKT